VVWQSKGLQAHNTTLKAFLIASAIREPQQHYMGLSGRHHLYQNFLNCTASHESTKIKWKNVNYSNATETG